MNLKSNRLGAFNQIRPRLFKSIAGSEINRALEVSGIGGLPHFRNVDLLLWGALGNESHRFHVLLCHFTLALGIPDPEPSVVWQAGARLILRLLAFAKSAVSVASVNPLLVDYSGLLGALLKVFISLKHAELVETLPGLALLLQALITLVVTFAIFVGVVKELRPLS